MLYRKHLLGDKKYKGSTINGKIQTRRQFLRWAYGASLIKTEISLEARFVRTSKRRRPTHLNRRGINALPKAAGSTQSFLGTRNLAIMQLFLHTAIRVAEPAVLTYSEVTLSERSGILRTREALSRVLRYVSHTSWQSGLRIF